MTDTILKNKLKECYSFMDMVNVMNEYYIIDTKIGIVTKAVIIAALGKFIKIGRFEKRVTIYKKQS